MLGPGVGVNTKGLTETKEADVRASGWASVLGGSQDVWASSTAPGYLYRNSINALDPTTNNPAGLLAVV